MNIRPLHDRIIVHRLEEGEQQIGGIIIPDTAKEKPQQGTVVAAGNGKAKDDGKPIPLDVKAGDRILFGKYAGQEIKLDGKEYLIMKEDDVLAVVNGEAKRTPTEISGKGLTAMKPKSTKSTKSTKTIRPKSTKSTKITKSTKGAKSTKSTKSKSTKGKSKGRARAANPRLHTRR